jgi:hypothetical protein
MRTLGVMVTVVVALAACGGDDDGGGGVMPPAAGPARFIALGDTGRGNADQRRVAMAMRDVCEDKGCDFVLLLGDNIYDAGVETTTDPQWQTKFEQPYSDVELPFFVALGNHDYGGRLLVDIPGLGNQFGRGEIQVLYTDVSMKWNMPATHYTFTWGDVGFIVLDTNSIVWSDTLNGDQAQWLPSALAEVSDKRWVFVAGHHPYLSNGEHGNAGSYDAPEIAGFDLPNPVPIRNGEALKVFFDEHVCGIGQVYFSGHDHNRQWIDEPTALCGTEMIVSGAGATTNPLRDRGNQVFYQDDTEVGFMYVVVDGDRFTGEFYSASGALDFTRTFMHP